MATVSIRNFTRRSVPRFAYEDVAKAVLPKWDISLVFVGSTRAQNLNKQLRAKDYIPNVLSYEVGENSGEIIICPTEAEKQAPAHDMDTETFILFLFIHGLLHLKGLPHGATMERCENELVAQFATRHRRMPTTHVTTHRNRNRHRDLSSKGRRSRRSR